ncbi:hypothetical protein PIB30_094798 [Stylosanthes scabra]|uniref:Uncharacterized protein n=1 Tax=Stylosanthes scabra TaxID=79078 RepID=A0ABU6UY22_9FABA|nr:hypothetical protein [Stylosanthes scabra]
MRGSLNPTQRLAAHIGHVHAQTTSMQPHLTESTLLSTPTLPTHAYPARLTTHSLSTASSSSVSVFDNHRFKSTFNEELYNTIVKNKKVIAECCIDLEEDEYPEIREQIALRGWRRLSAPKQEISIDLIHEFYANDVVTEEEMEEAGGHTFRSFVRGVPVDFSPGNIQTVMQFRTQVQGAATDFETRKEHDQ